MKKTIKLYRHPEQIKGECMGCYFIVNGGKCPGRSECNFIYKEELPEPLVLEVEGES